MNDTNAKETIARFWNDWAEGFDEAHANEDKGKWLEYFRSLMGAPGDQKVLDIGTGTGFLANMAAGLGFQAVGIDNAENMLKIAGEKAAKAGLSTQFQKADLNQLPFETGTFDYVVNSRVLWTLTDPDTALREWYRVLKEGGQLLSFIRLTEEGRIFTSSEIYTPEVLDALVFKHSSGEELMDKCRACGFSQVDMVKLPGIAEDIEAYGDWYVLRATRLSYTREEAIDAISGFWNRRSDTYDKDHELTSLDAWKKNLSALAGEDKNVRILDLATGTGMIANLLGEMGYKDVTGLDISEGMMDIARKHAEERGTGVRFAYGNAMALDAPDASADLIISCRLLWTLLEPEKAIAEWIRAVKEGGSVVALHEFDDDAEPEEKDEVWRHFLYGKNADPYLSFTGVKKQVYQEMFEAQGLKDVRLIHLDGCQTAENGKENWYALVGRKA